MSSSKSDTNVMYDSYIGGIGTVSFLPPCSPISPNQPTYNLQNDRRNSTHSRRPKFGGFVDGFTGDNCGELFYAEISDNQTDEDKLQSNSGNKYENKRTNINKTEEYNVGYKGLSILPWEDFVESPRKLNDLFHRESTHQITFDPEEVNVFFHGKNVMQPLVGDISENGKSWNITVQDMTELRQLRSWLCDRCSVFGVTLVFKDSRMGKTERAPCLVLLDPSIGSLGDRLYAALTNALDTMHNNRKFCLEINLNRCVERWCQRVMLTKCRAVGAKLIITNGEEYVDFRDAENIICCVLCFPIWALQTGIYKLHRHAVYDDYTIPLDSEDLFLHGAFQDVVCQRQHIFQGRGGLDTENVFRVRVQLPPQQSAAPFKEQQTDDPDSYKFICVKKVEGRTIVEHQTTSFHNMAQKRMEKGVTDFLPKAEMKNAKQQQSKEEIKCPEKDKAAKKFTEDSDEEDQVQIPEIASSFYKEEKKEVSNFEGSGSFFADRTNHLSPRLLSPIKLEEQNKTEDYENDSGVKTFREHSSNESESGTEEEVETDGDDFKDEVIKIQQTLPTKKLSDTSQSENVESVLNLDERKLNKKKRKHGMKKCLSDLTKTTEFKGGRPSKNDPRYEEGKKALKIAKKRDKKAKKGKSSRRNKKAVQENNEINSVAEANSNGEDADGNRKETFGSFDNKGFESSVGEINIPAPGQSDTSESDTNDDVEDFIAEDTFSDEDLDRKIANISNGHPELEGFAKPLNKKENRMAKSSTKIENRETESPLSETPVQNKPSIDSSKSRHAVRSSLENNQESADEGQSFRKNTGFKARNNLSMDLVSPISNEEANSNDTLPTVVVSVGRSEKTLLVDTTDRNKIELKSDIELSELESGEDVGEVAGSKDSSQSPTPQGFGFVKEPRKKTKRGRTQYNSTRRYLAVNTPKRYPSKGQR